MKVLCKNGNTVERFYDRSTRSSVTRVLDAEGNQLGDAEYDGNKDFAKFSLDRLVEANGGKRTGSVFLANLHYFFGQTDGTYRWPGGVVGGLLRQAKREIEAHQRKGRR